MIVKAVEKLYPYLPVTLQNAVCTTYGLREARSRFGKDFQASLNTLSKSEWWGKHEIEAHQRAKLRRIVNYAKQHVPYYRESGKYPDQINSIDEFKRIPVLTKSQLRASPQLFVSDNYKVGELIRGETSGTTGKPMVFYRDNSSVAAQWAIWSRHKHRFDVRYDDYHALFTGKPIVPATQQQPPYWRKNLAMNQLIFGMQHINDATIDSIVDVLEKEPLKFFTGYPSIIYQVAVTALNRGLKLNNGPRVVFTGAEPLYPWQEEKIRIFTGAEITDQYGTSEGIANASKCRYGAYHEDFEFGYIEIQPDGKSQDPEVGEIIMTGFSNNAMPLIRYKIGDRGKLVESACPCGRKSRILTQLEGRSEDFVTTPEGNQITRFDYIFKGINGLEEAQVVQNTIGAIDLLVVATDKFTISEQEKILKAVQKYISKTLCVNIRRVASIPRTSRGKFRAVVNNVK